MLQISSLKVANHSSCMFSVLEIVMREFQSVGWIQGFESFFMIKVKILKTKYIVLRKNNALALSAKGSRLNGGSCSRYSNISWPGGLQISLSSLDEPTKGLFLSESPLKFWIFASAMFCWLHVPWTKALIRLSAPVSLLPSLLVSLDDSASLSSPGLLSKEMNEIPLAKAWQFQIPPRQWQ